MCILLSFPIHQHVHDGKLTISTTGPRCFSVFSEFDVVSHSFRHTAAQR